jgi:ParB family transcriptional regulator, chromosome partitioning protein
LQPREVLLDLLAFCAALSVNAVRAKNDRAGIARLRHADALARALGLDMTKWFTPRVANYFGRVNRASILGALQEAKGVAPAPALLKMKKAELAALATRQIAGTGWLPEMLRVAGPASDEPKDSTTDTVVAAPVSVPDAGGFFSATPDYAVRKRALA